ncbi:glycoside hydrolase family 15 protein [Emcibacter sp. SYSU 3D8]|uniref:glycoside hydrolase family 15 protein n=1 Tax=Emcibacter sp. SYSU 3D8 TaxID=3133969 RepID=UPI0031FEBFB8
MDMNLGVIGNGNVAALIDSGGRICWHCLPRFDGDPVFCSLLNGDDPAAGFMEVTLENLASTSQEYEPNTAVLVTTLHGTDGAGLRITDFAPRFKLYGRIFRPAVLIRRVEPFGGIPLARMRVRPLHDHGASVPARTRGSNHMRFVMPGQTLRLTTDAPITYVESESPFAVTSAFHMVFGSDESVGEALPFFVHDQLERTREYWIEWSRYLSIPFEWQDAVIRAAITLKLCQFEETGAIVAALTTSIPEAPDEGRNWDYRHCWLRDAYFSVHALNRMSATRTMEKYLDYITTVLAIETDSDLKPVYGILPDRPLTETIVTSLAGYRGMGPVRIGNQAQEQIQHDSYGSVVLATAQMFFDRRLPNRGDERLFARLEHLGEKARERAFVPDAGLWELRGRTHVHTHSAALCWAACDRLARIALELELPDRAAYWRAEADHIAEVILDKAWNAELGSFVSALGGEDVDASLLLLREIGLVSADDPRFTGTLDQITRQLRRGDHLFRYSSADDFGKPRNAFTICTFWYIDALAAVGRRDEAREMFERTLACRNHLGLLSEDIDTVTGELWGNFPQTYSLVGLILCAMHLSNRWEDAF